MSRGPRTVLLALVVSIVGAAPSAVADAVASVPDRAVPIDTGSSRFSGSSEGARATDQANPGPQVRGVDVAAIDTGAARSDRHDTRGGHLLAAAPEGFPPPAASEFRQRVDSVTTSPSGGPGRDSESRAPPSHAS